MGALDGHVHLNFVRRRPFWIWCRSGQITTVRRVCQAHEKLVLSLHWFQRGFFVDLLNYRTTPKWEKETRLLSIPVLRPGDAHAGIHRLDWTSFICFCSVQPQFHFSTFYLLFTWLPGQEVDQRKLGDRLWKKTVEHVDWIGRMPYGSC